MSKHDARLRLRQMREVSESVLEAVEGKSRTDFPLGDLTTDGLLRRLVVIGNAASRVPMHFRNQRPGIPWQEIIDPPSRLLREYDTVDLDTVWRIIHEDLPPLLRELPGMSTEDPHGQ
jgi:uncharacterized protein with HEPN domain